MSTILDIQDIKEKIESRGKPITCRYCGKTFKIIDKNQKQLWIENKYVCVHCKEEWCILPKTERDLKYAQEKYLFSKSETDMVNMLRIMYPYIQSLIKKNYAKALKFYGALDYYSNEVTTIMVEEYLGKEDFKLDISFGGFLIHKIRQAIYNPKQFIDQHVSLDYEFEDGNNLHEMIADTKLDILQKIEQKEHEESLHKKIVGIIDGITKYHDNDYEDYIRIVSLYCYLSKGELAFDKIFQAFGRKGKEISEKTLNILRQELKKDSNLCDSFNKEIKHETKPLPIKNKMKLNITDLSGISWDLPKQKGEKKYARNNFR